MSIVIDVSDRENPDKSAIQDKRTVDISVSTVDIAASLSGSAVPPDSIKLNYTEQGIVILNDSNTETGGDVYYTVVYAEKIDYDVWKDRVNKQFVELEN